MPEVEKKTGAALIVGGGVGGMEAALNLANSGIKVFMIDDKPCIGGVMSQLDKTFPTNDCAMCSMAPRLVEIGRHKDIEIITPSEVESLEGDPGNFRVTLSRKPRYVNEEKCTGCGACADNCPVRNELYITDDFEKTELEEEDSRRVLGILDAYENKEESLIAILQDVNAAYRYLPEHVMKFLSHSLAIPLAQIYGIATFYTAFSLTPRGKYTVSVCLGTACHVRGAPKIIEAIERHLEIGPGETTRDMMFSLDRIRCLGCCGLAPVITINDEVHGKMNVVKTLKTIDGLMRTEGRHVEV